RRAGPTPYEEPVSSAKNIDAVLFPAAAVALADNSSALGLRARTSNPGRQRERQVAVEIQTGTVGNADIIIGRPVAITNQRAADSSGYPLRIIPGEIVQGAVVRVG